MDIICYNGEFFPLEEAKLSVTDAGMLYGQGVFTTARVEKSQILHSEFHFKRLAEGARIFQIPFRLNQEEFLSLCEQVIDANQLKTARLRATLTRGPVRGHPMQASEDEESLIITAVSWKDPENWDEGIRTVWAPFPKNHLSPLARVKSCNYTEFILAKNYAKSKDADDAIFLNVDDEVAEASMANIFWVTNGVLHTPEIDAGALPGTVRSQILQICQENSIEYHEGRYDFADLMECQEAFLTNTIRQIMPITNHDDTMIGAGEAGPLTKFLYTEYRKSIEMELEKLKK